LRSKKQPTWIQTKKTFLREKGRKKCKEIKLRLYFRPSVRVHIMGQQKTEEDEGFPGELKEFPLLSPPSSCWYDVKSLECCRSLHLLPTHCSSQPITFKNHSLSLSVSLALYLYISLYL
ncbi:hypothetical protein PanWU01x14_149650, partial [Parasponia andersonii]